MLFRSLRYGPWRRAYLACRGPNVGRGSGPSTRVPGSASRDTCCRLTSLRYGTALVATGSVGDRGFFSNRLTSLFYDPWRQAYLACRGPNVGRGPGPSTRVPGAASRDTCCRLTSLRYGPTRSPAHGRRSSADDEKLRNSVGGRARDRLALGVGTKNGGRCRTLNLESGAATVLDAGTTLLESLIPVARPRISSLGPDVLTPERVSHQDSEAGFERHLSTPEDRQAQRATIVWRTDS